MCQFYRPLQTARPEAYIYCWSSMHAEGSLSVCAVALHTVLTMGYTYLLHCQVHIQPRDKCCMCLVTFERKPHVFVSNCNTLTLQEGQYDTFSDMYQIGKLIEGLPFWRSSVRPPTLLSFVNELKSKQLSASEALQHIWITPARLCFCLHVEPCVCLQESLCFVPCLLWSPQVSHRCTQNLVL